MSVRLMARVFELDVPSIEKLVLLAMADHARDDGTGCYPSMGGLARKTSQSRRGVQGIVRRLERKGLLTATFISNGGKGRATEYRISLENQDQKALNFRGENSSGSDRGSANHVRSKGANGVRSTSGRECEPQGALLRTGFAGSANDSVRNCERGSHESLRTIIEPSGNKDTPAPSSESSSAIPISEAAEVQGGSLSEFIPIDAWMAYREMRTRIHRPITDAGRELIFQKLADLRDRGEDIRTVLETAIANSSYELFPVRKERNGNGHIESFAEKSQRKSIEVIREMRGDLDAMVREVDHSLPESSSQQSSNGGLSRIVK